MSTKRQSEKRNLVVGLVVDGVLFIMLLLAVTRCQGHADLPNVWDNRPIYLAAPILGEAKISGENLGLCLSELLMRPMDEEAEVVRVPLSMKEVSFREGEIEVQIGVLSDLPLASYDRIELVLHPGRCQTGRSLRAVTPAGYFDSVRPVVLQFGGVYEATESGDLRLDMSLHFIALKEIEDETQISSHMQHIMGSF